MPAMAPAVALKGSTKKITAKVASLPDMPQASANTAAPTSAFCLPWESRSGSSFAA